MSDLYLVLRSRLDPMSKWVYIDTAVLKEARESRGLSYEGVGRLANVSSKTYERYEKAGRLPEHDVEHFAEILGLEVERPARQVVTVGTADEPDPESILLLLGELRESVDGAAASTATVLEALARGIDRIEARLDAEDGPVHRKAQ